MGRQHLAVGIDVDAAAFSLFQQFFEVFQVVAGHQNCFAFHGADAHRCRHRMAIGAGIGFVKDFHDPDVDFAAAQRHAEQGIHAEVRLGQEVERLMEEGIDLLVDDTEDTGVVGVGGHAFQSEQDQVFQTNQVGAAGGQVFAQHQLLALGDQTVQIGSRLPGCGAGQFFRGCAGFQRRPVIQGFGGVADRDAFADDALQTGRIEVDIGDGGEQGFDDEFVDGCVLGTEHDGAVGVHRHPFGQIQQQVLQGGGLRVFAADAERVATGSFGGLFTLITKHCFIPLSFIFYLLLNSLR